MLRRDEDEYHTKQHDCKVTDSSAIRNYLGANAGIFKMEDTQTHKAHRVSHGARKEKKTTEKVKGNNPKAFAIQSVNKARRKFAYSLDQ